MLNPLICLVEDTLKCASDFSHVTEEYAGSCQTFKTERFAKLFKWKTSLTKSAFAARFLKCV